ncbi:MAG: MATE family efflux transporter [Clostridia bacterium]|nr:MATE family efflux transporter [Clostridia bacterium]
MSKAIGMDLTKGPIFAKIVKFSIPLILANILQLLFNAADIFVLGIFVSEDAVAAAGSNGALINLIINLFIGLSVGSNVMVGRNLGKNDTEAVRRYIGMSMLIGVVAGVGLLFIGFFGARTFLTWMDCDEKIIDMAVKYVKIYFLGMPIILLYNFCASILRAAGDSKRPLIYMAIGGVVNVGLNIFFVTVCGMDVEGVAIATVVSNGIASALTIIALIRSKGPVKLLFKYIRFYPKEFVELTKVGLPSGLQSCMFSISNVLIQSSVNSFGSSAMAGYSYEQQLSGFVYTAMNAIALACMSFVSQNLGAKEFKRIKDGIIQSSLFATAIGVVMGVSMYFLATPILHGLGASEEVIDYELQIMRWVALPYFMCGVMDTVAYAMRSFGKSFTTMIICLFWACIFRIVWIKTVFAKVNTIWSVFISYPISWILTIACILVFLIKTYNYEKRIYEKELKARQINN